MTHGTRLQDFDYNLPPQLIAQYPLRARDRARLMIIDRAAQTIAHDRFSNIGAHLPPSGTLVVNDSKVVAARLLGTKEATGGKVEIFLLNRLPDGYSYEALLRPLRRIKVDEKIIFNGGKLCARLKDVQRRIVRFNTKNIEQHLDRIGHIPLPPYIKRKDRAVDRTHYQTVYARHAGSVASPTAGLHFTGGLLKKLEKQGHAIKKLTLHINYATFKPVEEADIRDHRMHSESYAMQQRDFNSLVSQRRRGKKVIAVGTTSCRALETIARTKQRKGTTDIFMYPGYRFRMVDALITNFHLPRSTLLMLVCAFGSYDLIMRAYQEAIKEKYRFYSYGDCMLII